MLFRAALLVLLVPCLISCGSKSENADAPIDVKAVSLDANFARSNSSPEVPLNDGFVKHEQAAIEIAVNEWTRMGLKEMIDQEKPYRAELVDDVWEVRGTAPKNWIGGLASARVSQKDGKVLEAGHDK